MVVVGSKEGFFTCVLWAFSQQSQQRLCFLRWVRGRHCCLKNKCEYNQRVLFGFIGVCAHCFGRGNYEMKEKVGERGGSGTEV